jgi:hypothetical protein
MPLNTKPARHTACTCGSLRKASRRISQFYDAALAPVGIKSTQFSILAEVERGSTDGPLSMCEPQAPRGADQKRQGNLATRTPPLEHRGGSIRKNLRQAARRGSSRGAAVYCGER